MDGGVAVVAGTIAARSDDDASMCRLTASVVSQRAHSTTSDGADRSSAGTVVSPAVRGPRMCGIVGGASPTHAAVRAQFAVLKSANSRGEMEGTKTLTCDQLGDGRDIVTEQRLDQREIAFLMERHSFHDAAQLAHERQDPRRALRVCVVGADADEPTQSVAAEVRAPPSAPGGDAHLEQWLRRFVHHDQLGLG